MIGRPGVTIATLSTVMKRSDKTIRRALKRLSDEGRVSVVGKTEKGAELYAKVH